MPKVWKTLGTALLDLEQFWMSDLLSSFLESVWVRIKHAEKTCIDLWDQSAMLKVVEDVTQYLFKKKKRWYTIYKKNAFSHMQWNFYIQLNVIEKRIDNPVI